MEEVMEQAVGGAPALPEHTFGKGAFNPSHYATHTHHAINLLSQFARVTRVARDVADHLSTAMDEKNRLQPT